MRSTIHVRNTLPITLKVLLPKCHFSITTTDRKNITRQAPGYTPNDIRELSRWRRSTTSGSEIRRRIKGSFYPRRSRGIFGPDEDGFILGSGGDIGTGKTNVWGPGYVSDPISVSFKCFFFDPRLGIFAIAPNFDEIVTAGASETFDGGYLC
jgi:hypothetical protein